MNIGYISSNGYSHLMGTSIISLLENNSHSDTINIYVLDDDISDENKEDITKIVCSYGRKITFIDKSTLVKFVTKNKLPPFNNSYVTYAKIFVDVCFNNLDRILILDCDTIINGSLTEMYSLDFDGKLLAAVPELTAWHRSSEDPNIIYKKNYYYNTGVLLWNNEKIREINFYDRIEKVIDSYGVKYRLADQSLVNLMLEEEEVIPLKYIYNYNINIHMWDKVRPIVQKEYEERGLGCNNSNYSRRLKENEIIIIHYLGDRRPWIKGKYAPLSRKYREYKRKSPWRSEKRESYYTKLLIQRIRDKPNSIISNKILGYPYVFVKSILEYRRARKS